MAHEEIAKKLAYDMFVNAGVTANLDKADLINAVSALDTAMNATTDQAATQYPGTSIMVAMRNYIQNAEPDFSNEDTALALAYWAMEQAGIL